MVIIGYTKGLLVKNTSKARWQAHNITRERCTYKIIAMLQSKILVGQGVRSRRNIILVALVKAQVYSQRGVNGRFLEIRQTLMNLTKIRVKK